MNNQKTYKIRYTRWVYDYKTGDSYLNGVCRWVAPKNIPYYKRRYGKVEIVTIKIK